MIEMRGLPYEDEGWEEILDSLTFREMRDLFNEGAFKTSGIPKIGLPGQSIIMGFQGRINLIHVAVLIIHIVEIFLGRFDQIIIGGVFSHLSFPF